MPDKADLKVQKKLAKAEAKTVKRGVAFPGGTVPGDPVQTPVPDDGKTPAERSAEAAEKQVSLNRWKVIFGALSALIALVSLVVLFLNS